MLEHVTLPELMEKVYKKEKLILIWVRSIHNV
jgi:hypothetical protein